MVIKISLSSIPLMLEYLKNMKAGKASKKQIDDIMNHKDYIFEFNRYKPTSKEKIIDYFSSLNKIRECDIPEFSPDRKYALKIKHNLWLWAIENVEYYENLYRQMESFLSEKELFNICNIVRNGLPAHTNIGDVRIISTMSIGPSFGYVYDNALHFDLMGINRYCTLQELPAIIAHETHHLAMLKYTADFRNRLTLEENYIFRFTGEGLAIKFCNNAKGAFSKPIYTDRRINEGLDDFSMKYLNEHFEESFEIFSKTLKNIRSGKTTKNDIEEQFNNFWWNPYLPEQSRDEDPLLKQTRIYSFGNDLFGIIYDAYGLDTLFDCVRNPVKTLQYFNSASESLGYSLLLRLPV